MSIYANMAAVRSFFDAFNGNVDLVDAILTPDSVQHDPATPLPAAGPELARMLFGLYRSAFPDLHFTVADIFGAGDRITARWVATGTHLGELMGIPATGRRAEVTGINVCRMENERIAEMWVNWDTLGLLRQLGAIPAPATEEAASSGSTN